MDHRSQKPKKKRERRLAYSKKAGSPGAPDGSSPGRSPAPVPRCSSASVGALGFWSWETSQQGRLPSSPSRIPSPKKGEELYLRKLVGALGHEGRNRSPVHVANLRTKIQGKIYMDSFCMAGGERRERERESESERG